MDNNILNSNSKIDEINVVNSLFEQPWWLNAVAFGQWNEIIIKNGNEVMARFPYVLKKIHNLTYITMPQLTQTLGPWLKQADGKYAKQLTRQKDLLEEIIGSIPSFDSFSVHLSPVITNWLPFSWAGFQQTTRYTYRIDDLTDLDQVWSNFLPNIRTDIKKAEKCIIVRNDLSLDKFIDLNELTFKRQNMQPISASLIKEIDKACLEHNARQIFFAVDAQEKIHAAIYIVTDKSSSYYLMGGGDPELRNSGATSLLIWEAIKYSSTVSKAFDFEGSMIKPIERFFRAFGGKQIPYFRITKLSKRMKLINNAIDTLRILRIH